MKRIGISLRVENIQKYNEKRDALSQDWIVFLQKLNLMPVLIPNKIDNIEKYILELKLDGVILSGGDNIGDFPDRDETERQILEIAKNRSIPILGVCRGMQIINNFFGGSHLVKSDKKHVNNDHSINLTKDFQFCKKESITVNSYHNNVIITNNLGYELVSFATHDDETVEGIKHSKYPIIGVMWHPERNQDENSVQLLKEIF